MGNPGTILLAEDDPDDVFLVQRALLQAGITLSLNVVRDGAEVLRYFSGEGAYADRQKFPIPLLLLLDLDMPLLTGFDVLAWLRRLPQFQNLPVVVFTASCLSPDVARAYRLGANSFLTKPTELIQLTAALREMIHFWAAHPPVNPSPDSAAQP